MKTATWARPAKPKSKMNSMGRAVTEWVRALAWNGDRTYPAGFEPHFGKNFSLRNFGNSVYPSLPVSFGGDTKSRRSLLSGVYARGSKTKRSHQPALECVTVVDSTTHSKKKPKVRLCGWKRCPAAALKKTRRKRTEWGNIIIYDDNNWHCTNEDEGDDNCEDYEGMNWRWEQRGRWWRPSLTPLMWHWVTLTVEPQSFSLPTLSLV